MPHQIWIETYLVQYTIHNSRLLVYKDYFLLWKLNILLDEYKNYISIGKNDK